MRWFAPCALVAATLALGSLLTGRVPMTSDEATSAAIVDRSFRGLVSVLGRSDSGFTMMPYHLGLWVWTQIGTSDHWIRMFSVLGGSVAMLLLYALCRRWFSSAIGVAACLVLMCNPFFHRYLIEARSYSWMMALGLAFLLVLDDVVRTPRIRHQLALGIVAGVGLLSHALFALVLVACIVAFAASGHLTRVTVRRLVLPFLIASALMAPVMRSLAVRGETHDQAKALTAFRFVAGASTLLGSLPSSLFVAAGICVLAATAIRRRDRTLPTMVLLTVTALPVLLLAALSLAEPLFLARYLVPVLPIAVMATVVGYARIAPESARNTAVAVVVLGALVAGILGPDVGDARNSDARAAAVFLEQEVRPGDVLLFEQDFVRLHIGRYGGYMPETDIQLIAFDDAHVEPRTRTLDQVDASVRSARRIWVVTLTADSALVDRFADGRPQTTMSFKELRVILLDAEP
jgi:mannosyltransferase